ncbi:hypothetical protein, partial [Mycobacterium sp. 050134]|uniref:hypothetical protein n=1 Tax=Mycobacterium sp. 050134 TaxID=3096111 RepID=UPI002ED9F565
MAMLVALALEAWERSANAATAFANEAAELGDVVLGSVGTNAERRGAAVDRAMEAVDSYEMLPMGLKSFNTTQGLHRRLAKRGRQYQRAVEQFEDVGRRSTRLG